MSPSVIHDTVKKDSTQWTACTQTQPSAPVILWVETKWGASYYKTPCHWVLPCSFSLKLCNCWWNGLIDIATNIWTCLTKDMTFCLMWLYKKCTTFHPLLWRWGMIWGTHWKITGPHCNSFYVLLLKTNTRTQILSILRFLHFSDNTNEPKLMKIMTNYGKWELHLISF